jgi:hypothetical protein
MWEELWRFGTADRTSVRVTREFQEGSQVRMPDACIIKHVRNANVLAHPAWRCYREGSTGGQDSRTTSCVKANATVPAA